MRSATTFSLILPLLFHVASQPAAVERHSRSETTLDPAAGIQASSDLSIGHDAIDCWPRDAFLQLEADIQPDSDIETARIYFRSEDFEDFYYVEMVRGEDGGFQAVMPMPNEDTEKVIYYIEAVDSAFNMSRTVESDPTVTAGDSCTYKRYIGIPSIVVGSVVPNVAAIPAGFQASGITGFTGAGAGGAAAAAGAGATGAGLSTAAIVGIAAGGAAAAVATAVVVSGEDPLDVDDDNDGFTENQGDCDDTNASINPNGSVSFINARFQPARINCPVGVNSAIVTTILFDGRNNQCNTVTVDSVSGRLVITRTRGNVQNNPGEVVPFEDATPSPTTLGVGSSATHRIDLDFTCQNPEGGDASLVEASGEITVDSSAGTFNVDVSNLFTLDFPLTAPAGGARPIKGLQTGAGNAISWDHRPSQEQRIRWTSELRVTGATGRLVFNGADQMSVSQGVIEGTSTAQIGQNRVEATLDSGAGQLGTWRFDFKSAEPSGFELGSLQVLEGEAVQTTESAVVFRLEGVAGERIVFTFRTK